MKINATNFIFHVSVEWMGSLHCTGKWNLFDSRTMLVIPASPATLVSCVSQRKTWRNPTRTKTLLPQSEIYSWNRPVCPKNNEQATYWLICSWKKQVYRFLKIKLLHHLILSVKSLHITWQIQSVVCLWAWKKAWICLEQRIEMTNSWLRR